MANLVNTLNYTANQIDTAELSKIKNQFLLRDRDNIENSERILAQKANPVRYFDNLSTPDSLEKATLRGPSYPLELDGSGGIKMSYGIERIGQAMDGVQRKLMIGSDSMSFDTDAALFTSLQNGGLVDRVVQ